MAKSEKRHVDLSRALRVIRTLPEKDATIDERRKLVADFCKLVGKQVGKPTPTVTIHNASKLAPRLRQTLERLLAGDSEKQAAMKLGLSQHTVHVYVKTLYKKYDVSSRGELLARCLTPEP